MATDSALGSDARAPSHLVNPLWAQKSYNQLNPNHLKFVSKCIGIRANRYNRYRERERRSHPLRLRLLTNPIILVGFVIWNVIQGRVVEQAAMRRYRRSWLI